MEVPLRPDFPVAPPGTPRVPVPDVHIAPAAGPSHLSPAPPDLSPPYLPWTQSVDYQCTPGASDSSINESLSTTYLPSNDILAALLFADSIPPVIEKPNDSGAVGSQLRSSSDLVSASPPSDRLPEFGDRPLTLDSFGFIYSSKSFESDWELGNESTRHHILSPIVDEDEGEDEDEDTGSTNTIPVFPFTSSFPHPHLLSPIADEDEGEDEYEDTGSTNTIPVLPFTSSFPHPHLLSPIPEEDEDEGEGEDKDDMNSTNTIRTHTYIGAGSTGQRTWSWVPM